MGFKREANSAFYLILLTEIHSKCPLRLKFVFRITSGMKYRMRIYNMRKLM